jgi:hypothetical protein
MRIQIQIRHPCVTSRRGGIVYLDPDPAYQINADPDPDPNNPCVMSRSGGIVHLDLDTASQINADPDPDPKLLV